MMLTLNQTLGYYTPSFFKIYIASDAPIDLNNLTLQQRATFVHEYTHFIQDFTTLVGLQNIVNTFEWLRLYLTETYDRRKVEIPVSFDHKILNLNQRVSTIAWGSSIDLNRISTLENIKSVAAGLEAAILAEYPDLGHFKIVKAVAVTPAGKRYEIEIGTLAVMESMAYLAEGLMGLPVIQSPDYPYNTVRLMADKLCGQATLSDEILFALCDVALQCTTPGVAMYEMLAGIKSGVYQTPNDGYKVYGIFPAAFNEWHNTNPNGMVNQAIDHLLGLIGGPMGQRYNVWVDRMMTYAVSQRRNRPDFLLQMIRQRDHYRQIVNKVGTPLMVNAVEDYTKVPPAQFPQNFPLNMDVEFFMAINYIMGLFELGRRECPLQEWCRSSGINVDHNCIVNPPLRSDTEKYASLCPVSGIWRHWNLGRYVLNRQCIFRPICK